MNISNFTDLKGFATLVYAGVAGTLAFSSCIKEDSFMNEKGYIYKVPYTSASQPDVYLCLSLGFISTEGLTIIREGLQNGESAVFSVTGRGNTWNVVLTGRPDGNPVILTIPGMEIGDYTVVETPWSWAYNAETVSRTQNISTDPIFRFSSTAATGTPLHGEGAKRNVM